jgi:hypothetical protein
MRGERLLLELIDRYFLILIIVHGLLVGIIDYGRYKKDCQNTLSRKARVISGGIMIIGIALFIVRKAID